MHDLLTPHGIDVVPITQYIPELQSIDLRVIVEQKCIDAFSRIGRPLLVEHTALYLDAMNGLPGGLGQIFWDSLRAERFCDLFGRASPLGGVRAVSALGYCDGQRIYYFVGEIKGSVAPQPIGPSEFEWDCVFIPEGATQSLAEMGIQKQEVSMRRGAVDEFVAHIRRSAP